VTLLQVVIRSLRYAMWYARRHFWQIYWPLESWYGGAYFT